MRVSKETMGRHHKEILSAASRMLRQRGVDGVSVADLMQASGLTHGGFYRHFASKEALVAEATAATFNELVSKLEERTTQKGDNAALSEYVTRYLSQRHVDTPEMGCPIPAYGSDVARENPAVRAAFHEGVDRLLKWISAGLDCPAEEKKGRAVELLSIMVGAIVMARAAGDKSLSKEILHNARRHAERLMAPGGAQSSSGPHDGSDA